ncbi:hypothetical protein AP1_0370 [Aeromonas phage AP1]|nr:hypothetical protein AP1_0370 [Aeromonas phage AP1]
MEKYLVGGAVRDQIMGKPVKDRDWVVVGSTKEEMEGLGYKCVGAHFPVYLDNDGEEIALARTEVSTGIGYNDFQVDFNPDVTIEEDLYRRDFTINAIAYDPINSVYIDPYHGIQDIGKKLIRMVNPYAFRDDPLRVFRAIRFTGRYGFKMEPETEKAVTDMIVGGALDMVSKERVFIEFMKCMEDMCHVDVFMGILRELDVVEFFGFDREFVKNLSKDGKTYTDSTIADLCYYCEDFDSYLKVHEKLHLTSYQRMEAEMYYFSGSRFEVLDYAGATHDTPKLHYALMHQPIRQEHIDLWRSVSAKDFPELQGKELGQAIKQRRKELIDEV